METSDDHIHETVALHPQPVFHLVRRNILHVAGLVEAGEGIGALCSYVCHHLVVLVRHEISRCQL